MSKRPAKFGVRFLRMFGWMFLAFGLVSLMAVGLSFLGDPPPWNRFDRLGDAGNFLWIALLQFTLARYESRDR